MQNSAKFVQHPRSQIYPRRIENAPPEGVKSTLGGSKIEPRSRRGGPGAPKSAQELPKSLPRGVQECSESAPRRPRTSKSGPRAAQERPKSAQEGPKTTLKASGGAFGDHFDTHKLEKRPFGDRSVARLARKARSVSFSVEFQSVRAGANMGKTSKYHWFL